MGVKREVVWITVALAGLTLAGCGEEGGAKAPPPDMQPMDQGVSAPDAAPMEDSPDAGMVDERGAFDLSGAGFTGSVQGGAGARVWVLSSAPAPVELQLELYEEYGGPTRPSRVALDDRATDYARCSICLRVQSGCAGEGEARRCAQTWMPQAGGRVIIDALGEAQGAAFAGAIQGVTMVPVQIDPESLATQVVDGEPRVLSDLPFGVPLEGPPAECGGHGHAHGNHCHCDPGYRPDPDDPLNCVEA